MLMKKVKLPDASPTTSQVSSPASSPDAKRAPLDSPCALDEDGWPLVFMKKHTVAPRQPSPSQNRPRRKPTPNQFQSDNILKGLPGITMQFTPTPERNAPKRMEENASAHSFATTVSYQDCLDDERIEIEKEVDASQMHHGGPNAEEKNSRD